jgi:hypothetical protein
VGLFNLAIIAAVVILLGQHTAAAIVAENYVVALNWEGGVDDRVGDRME